MLASHHEVMMNRVLALLKRAFPELEATQTAVDCRQNHVGPERRLGKEVCVIRKGAVRAGES